MAGKITKIFEYNAEDIFADLGIFKHETLKRKAVGALNHYYAREYARYPNAAQKAREQTFYQLADAFIPLKDLGQDFYRHVTDVEKEPLIVAAVFMDLLDDYHGPRIPFDNDVILRAKQIQRVANKIIGEGVSGESDLLEESMFLVHCMALSKLKTHKILPLDTEDKGLNKLLKDIPHFVSRDWKIGKELAELAEKIESGLEYARMHDPRTKETRLGQSAQIIDFPPPQ